VPSEPTTSEIGSHVDRLPTPAFLVDPARLASNIATLDSRIARLGVDLRPHVKTTKSPDIMRMATAAHSGSVAVSTLREAEYFFAAGFRHLLYAVTIAPDKLPRAAALAARGADLTLVADSEETALAIIGAQAQYGVTLPTLVEIDADGGRSGVAPDGDLLLAIAAILSAGSALRGVLCFVGRSYASATLEEIRSWGKIERDAAVGSALRLRAAGHDCSVVSVGCTPNAYLAQDLTGVTEVRAGVYLFQDLTMAKLGLCMIDEIAASVLATIIGHNPRGPWAIIDAGGLALSKDQGLANSIQEYGYGVVADVEGKPIGDLIVANVSQEHGLVTSPGGGLDFEEVPIGTKVRVYTNHVCMTAAAYDQYHVVRDGKIEHIWSRCNGW
jgi:D-serine deaminase-like pyridoxal phosphate-dependent protein